MIRNYPNLVPYEDVEIVLDRSRYGDGYRFDSFKRVMSVSPKLYLFYIFSEGVTEEAINEAIEFGKQNNLLMSHLPTYGERELDRKFMNALDSEMFYSEYIRKFVEKALDKIVAWNPKLEMKPGLYTIIMDDLNKVINRIAK